MPSIQEIRQKYPQYNDMSDTDLADSFHNKFYSDIPKDKFYQTLGVKAEPAISKTASFGMGMADLASFGLDDELRGMGRALGSKFTDKPMSISEGINQMRGEHKAAQEANSGSYLAGQVTGGVVPALLTRGQSVFGQTAKNAPLLAKMGRGAVQAGVPAAAYGVGSGEGLEDRALKGLGYGAGGAVVGAGLPAVAAGAKALGKGAQTVADGVKAAGPEEMDDVAKGMGKEASDIYNKFRQTGATLNKNRAVNIYNKMEKAVSGLGKTNARLHGDTLSVLDDVKNVVKSGDPVGLEELDLLRQLFDDVITKNTDVAGKLNADALRSVKAKQALDEAVGSLNGIDIIGGKKEAVDLLLAGRAKWAQKSKYESVARIIKKSGGDPARLKKGFENFVNDPRKIRGFTKEEIDALRAAGTNTMNEKVLKGLGRFGIDPGNVFLPLMTGGIGALGGAATGTLAGPAAGALVAGGTVARQANKFVARAKADNVLKQIKARK